MEHREGDSDATLEFLRRVERTSAQVASLMQAIEALLLRAATTIRTLGHSPGNTPEATEWFEALERSMKAACRLGDDVANLTMRLKADLADPPEEMQRRIYRLNPDWKETRAAAVTCAREAEQMVRYLGVRAQEIMDLMGGLAAPLATPSQIVLEELMSRLRVQKP